ncbi:HNH endonuclease [Pseudomonas phage vB_PpuM-KoPa-4]|uniref:HNH endonuclease n=1 Tax=Pseudomonas phage vB_PpuM-KoPa-4 TaxID=3132618 RepID=A0AAX4MY82_9CAUD
MTGSMSEKCSNVLEYCKSNLRYDPETGVLTWKSQVSPRVVVGTEAGSINKHGYRTIGIMGKVMKAHRIAWAIYHGVWPDCDIDHKNRVRSDNRIGNLRLATVVQNANNQSKAKNNTSGYKGVSWCTTRGKYRASIVVDGKRKTLGYYITPEEAHAVLEVARQAHKEYRTSGI